jgi:hypothetical protein
MEAGAALTAEHADALFSHRFLLWERMEGRRAAELLEGAEVDVLRDRAVRTCGGLRCGGEPGLCCVPPAIVSMGSREDPSASATHGGVY